jgi:hypothetical protein
MRVAAPCACLDAARGWLTRHVHAHACGTKRQIGVCRQWGSSAMARVHATRECARVRGRTHVRGWRRTAGEATAAEAAAGEGVPAESHAGRNSRHATSHP